MNKTFRFVVRIENAGRRPVGVGCLVGPDLIATCAHVVADALGERALCFGDIPEAHVGVSFPFLSDTRRQAAEVITWHPAARPPDLPLDGLGDLAILRVGGMPATDGAWVRLSDRLNLAPEEFIAFGYPADMEMGDFAEGRTVGLMPNLWYRLGAERQIGRRIAPGFSGGPVVLRDLDLVGGLVVLSDRDTALGGGLMISGQVVNRAIDAIREREGAVVSSGSTRTWDTPGLPVGFLSRVALQEKLRNALVSAKSGVVSLIGPLGIGKSVVAAAIVEDGTVLEAFRDGVHWLGGVHSKSSREVQVALHGQLTERQPASLGIAEKRVELGTLLAGQRTLVVVDGLDDTAKLAALPLEAEGPVFLVTARRDLRPEGDRSGDSVEVGPLSAEEAISLLEKAAGSHWPEAGQQHPDVGQILSTLGGSPMLLGLVGYQVRESGGDWASAADVCRAQAPDRDGLHQKRSPHLDAFVDGALSALSKSDRLRCEILAVVPPGASVSWRVLQTLWDCENLQDIEETASVLTRRSLADWTSRGTLELHDLPRAFLRSRTADLGALHRTIVGRYRRLCSGRWGILEHDGYVGAHLAAHMAEAGLSSDLEALHSDFGWLRRRLETGSPPDLAGDLMRYGPTRGLRSLGRVVRQAARPLSRSPLSLAPQVLARLAPSSNAGPLRAAARAAMGAPAIAPLAASLASPMTFASVLRGHENAVAAVAISADGGRALSASVDHTLRCWDLNTGECLAMLGGHSDYVRAAAISADGATGLSGSYDGSVRVWDLTDGGLRTVIDLHRGPVKSVALSSSAAHAVSGGADGKLRFWSLSNTVPEKTIDAGGGEIRSVALSGKADVALTASADGVARLWNFGNSTGQAASDGIDAPIRAVALDHEGRLAVLGTADGSVIGRDLVRGTELFRVAAHEGPVTSLSLCPGRAVVASASRDGFVKLLDLHGAVLATSRAHSSRVLSVAVASGGDRLLSGAGDARVRVWDLDDLYDAPPTGGHSLPVTALAVSSDGHQAASGSQDGTIGIWDVLRGTRTARLCGHRARVTDVSFAGDGNRVISASLDATMRLWAADGSPSSMVIEMEAAITAVAVEPVGGLALAGTMEGSLAEWDLASGTMRRQLAGKRQRAVRALVTAKGRIVALYPEGRLEVRNAASDELVRAVGLAAGYPCAISSDGCWAIASDHAGQIARYDLASGECVNRTAGPDAHASCIAFLDGRLAAIGCHDGSVHLWNQEEGEPLASFETDWPVVSVAGAAHVLAVGDEAGGVHLLEVLAR